MSIFNPLQVVGRGSETQHQVIENENLTGKGLILLVIVFKILIFRREFRQ